MGLEIPPEKGVIMTKSGIEEMDRLTSLESDVEARDAAEELERIEQSIKFEAEASVEAADKAGDAQAAAEAAETAAKASELEQATEEIYK